MGDKYFAADTRYDEGEAEYDAADYNYQIVDHSDDVVALCTDATIRDYLLELLNANPFPAVSVKPDAS